MSVKQLPEILLISIFVLTYFQSCRQPDNARKKIVYINSYHRGHPPSDEITAGFMENLPTDSFEIIAYFMDTKRNPSPEYIENRAAELMDSIQEIKPDLLVVSDDNAVKYLVEPNFQDHSMPVVFCGVNWSAAQYALSGGNVTGILEMLPVAELLLTMKSYYPSMKKLLVLNENTTTSRKTAQLLDTLFNRIGISATHELVDDFDSWKTAFKEANQSYDIIYLQTNAAIRGWDHDEAVRFIDQHMEVPLVTCEDFMMPYSVFGMTQVSREQGTWAASTAKRILQGTSPADIPVSRNRMQTIWLNTALAEKAGFRPDSALRSRARIIPE
jgi:ABC-type uncharacterized transport system substrate-binding protein